MKAICPDFDHDCFYVTNPHSCNLGGVVLWYGKEEILLPAMGICPFDAGKPINCFCSQLSDICGKLT